MLERSDAQVKCLNVTSYVHVGNTATFEGPADVVGVAQTYGIVVQDNADTGAGADSFSIETDSFSVTGLLTQGNIQVHHDAATLP